MLDWIEILRMDVDAEWILKAQYYTNSRSQFAVASC